MRKNSRVKRLKLFGSLCDPINIAIPVRRREAREVEIIASGVFSKPSSTIVEVCIGKIQDVGFVVLDLTKISPLTKQP